MQESQQRPQDGPKEPPTPTDYFFGGVSAFAEQLDKLVIAVLRDGRHIIGTLASYDHFGSIVLQDARERHFASGKFCDLPMGGIYLIRGENLTLVGEVDGDTDAANPLLVEAEWEEVRALEEAADEAAKRRRAPTATSVWQME